MYIWLLLFLTCFLLISAPAYWLLQSSERRKKFRRMLEDEKPRSSVIAATAIFDSRPERERSLVGRLLARVPRFDWLSQWVQPPGTKSNVGMVLAASGAFALAGGFAGRALGGLLGPYALPLGAALFSFLPFLYIRKKSNRFLKAFEEQLPDAVDFLARSLRAGTALSLSLEMLVAETSEPVRSQFLSVTRELALGAPVELALKGLFRRTPILELRFFVAAVLLQRETGGNLGEILDKLSSAIRERLQLKAKIKASSAQGRLTARILSVLPVAVLFLIQLISPMYLRTMTGDPSGRMMLMAAVIAQVIAYVCMRKITNIEF